MSNIITAAVLSAAIVITNDPGGTIINGAYHAAVARKNGTQIIFDGRCDSACTVYLSLPPSQLCVTPRARFGFHLPYGGTKEANQAAARFFLRNYPRWVSIWLSARGGMTSQIKTMPAEYAAVHVGWCKGA